MIAATVCGVFWEIAISIGARSAAVREPIPAPGGGAFEPPPIIDCTVAHITPTHAYRAESVADGSVRGETVDVGEIRRPVSTGLGPRSVPDAATLSQ